MDTLATAVRMLRPGYYCASIDSADAYYSVSIDKTFRKYLRFVYEGQLYQFTCIPNGLSPGPRAFTKLLKSPLAYLRQQFGMNIIAYLEDLIIMGKTPLEVAEAVKQTLWLMTDLGFKVSVSKSTLIPSQEIEFLGFRLDTISITVHMLENKATKLISLCEEIWRDKELTIRKLAKLLGGMTASLPAE